MSGDLDELTGDMIYSRYRRPDYETSNQIRSLEAVQSTISWKLKSVPKKAWFLCISEIAVTILCVSHQFTHTKKKTNKSAA